MSCKKIQQQHSFNFLAGASRFRLKISPTNFPMYPNKVPNAFTVPQHHRTSKGPGYIVRVSGPLEEKQPHNITEPPPPLYLHTGFFQSRHSSFYTIRTLSIDCQKNGSCQSSSSILRTPGAYVWGENDRKGFFLECLANHLLGWRWHLMAVLETWWPPRCYFPLFPTSLIIPLIVHGGNIYMGPLPGKFVTVPVAFNFK